MTKLSTDVTTFFSPTLTLSQSFQDSIDFMAKTNGGGYVEVPPGTYDVGGLTLYGGVSLRGSGRGCTTIGNGGIDQTILTLNGNMPYSKVEDIFIVGYMPPAGVAAVHNVVEVAENMPVDIIRTNIWGGHAALRNMGNDGTVENCFIAGWTYANLITGGANWYRRVKFDTAGGTPVFGAYLGTPGSINDNPMENFFVLCDFSGGFSGGSFVIQDGPTGTNAAAMTRLTNCVFSGNIGLNSHIWTLFEGCTLGGSLYTDNPARTILSNCIKVGAPIALAAGCRGAGNVGISGVTP
jgi:hypothetical protein